MRRQLTIAALAVGLALLAGVPLGCSKGEYVPLVGPGASDLWPADSRWMPAYDLFVGREVHDGASAGGDSLVVLVGSAGTVFEYVDGQWSRRPTGLRSPLRSVVSLGDGAFMAVGDRGGVSRRQAGQWVTEETGTVRNLSRVLLAAGEIWALGEQGTILRRTDVGWASLPPPGPLDLLSAAVLHDTLFVTITGDSSQVRTWDGTGWSTMPAGPWGNQPVRGVVATPAGRLLAVADSLYQREPSGWRPIRPERFWHFSESGFTSTVVGGMLWFRNGGWYRLDPADPDGPLNGWVPRSQSILVPWGEDAYLTATTDARLFWVHADEVNQDPAGKITIGAEIKLAAGGPLFLTTFGVVRRDLAGLKLVVPAERIPRYRETGNWRACGRDESDFYLVSNRSLCRIRDGQVISGGDWSDYMFANSVAVTGTDVLYLANSSGLWRWTADRWERQLPVQPEQVASFKVWSDGNGGLVARGLQGDFYRLRGDLWLPLGFLRGECIVLAAADGTLVGVQPAEPSLDYAGGNELLIYDERAAAFRSLWGRGMGVLQNIGLAGGASRHGELLVWTHEPAMVFRLNGSPAQADWELVAGPLNAGIRSLIRLPGGELLALDESGARFHIHRD